MSSNRIVVPGGWATPYLKKADLLEQFDYWCTEKGVARHQIEDGLAWALFMEDLKDGDVEVRE